MYHILCTMYHIPYTIYHNIYIYIHTYIYIFIYFWNPWSRPTLWAPGRKARGAQALEVARLGSLAPLACGCLSQDHDPLLVDIVRYRFILRVVVKIMAPFWESILKGCIYTDIYIYIFIC